MDYVKIKVWVCLCSTESNSFFIPCPTTADLFAVNMLVSLKFTWIFLFFLGKEKVLHLGVEW